MIDLRKTTVLALLIIALFLWWHLMFVGALCGRNPRYISSETWSLFFSQWKKLRQLLTIVSRWKKLNQIFTMIIFIGRLVSLPWLYLNRFHVLQKPTIILQFQYISSGTPISAETWHTVHQRNVSRASHHLILWRDHQRYLFMSSKHHERDASGDYIGSICGEQLFRSLGANQGSSYQMKILKE